MSENSPKYWGSWEGKIITLLVLSDGAGVSWENLVKQTGLTGFQLKSALATLFDAHVISKEEFETNYHLADERLRKEYSAYIDDSNQINKETKCASEEQDILREAKARFKETKHSVEEESSTDERSDLSQWIYQWRDSKDMSFSLENKHFFLSGLDLDEFTKQVILNIEGSMLVANPCLENCYLTITLEHVARKGAKIKVVTRPPTYGESNYDKKQDCHALLRSAGVLISYHDEVHSKLISIDNKVAIVSSTNFYSGYSGGTSLEAGMISIDNKVVSAVDQYIIGLFEKKENAKF